MSEQTARVTRIQRFCTHDGPGIRTTVFFKGCPLRCVWCHNPETRDPAPGLLYSENLCAGCGECAAVCPAGAHTFTDGHVFNRTKCIRCSRCVEACPSGALEPDSRVITIGEIMDTVLSDRVFYGDAGGLTVSGGEPMFQPEACLALLQAARAAGVSTAIETSGCFDGRYLPQLAALTDTFLWDFKDHDPERHRQYTGASNAVILKNLRTLDSLGANILLRCIIVEGVNACEAHMSAIAQVFHSCRSIREAELLPYHAYGTSKAVQAGIKAEPHREWIPSDARMEELSASLRAKGVRLHNK